ncbi:hypothetical protein, partial [Bacillus sp. JJ722]|uniref:hypothetical protein n=1 Tax=Bacillus sp. JJ722 TaxID=3122973 RepID=UPI002FFDD9E2
YYQIHKKMKRFSKYASIIFFIGCMLYFVVRIMYFPITMIIFFIDLLFAVAASTILYTLYIERKQRKQN